MSANVDATSNVQDGDMNPPRIEFLYFAACPNAPTALALLHDALRMEGIASEVEMIAVETEEAAQRYRFFGSPTIRINGVDVSPPPTSAVPTLSCRLYVQADGRFAPYPPEETLMQALRQSRRHTNT